jgi:hypothetical protein
MIVLVGFDSCHHWFTGFDIPTALISYAEIEALGRDVDCTNFSSREEGPAKSVSPSAVDDTRRDMTVSSRRSLRP